MVSRTSMNVRGPGAGFAARASRSGPLSGARPAAPLKPHFQPRPGLVMGQRYQLEEYLNKGGMGQVWKARDRRTGNNVAVKIALSSFEGRDHEELLRAEAGILRKLSGTPGLVGYISDKETDQVEDGYFYLAMELVEGKAVSQLLQIDGALDAEDTAYVGFRVALALQRMHNLAVLHGDISINNVMLLMENDAVSLKLIDLGISAAHQSALAGRGNVLGNVPYMAPELLKGAYLSPLSDIYALGVTLYVMLAGKLPFLEDTEDKTKLAHLVKDVPEHPGIPEPMKKIIWKCLEKNPINRYRYASELAQDLAAAYPQVAEAA